MKKKKEKKKREKNETRKNTARNMGWWEERHGPRSKIKKSQHPLPDPLDTRFLAQLQCGPYLVTKALIHSSHTQNKHPPTAASPDQDGALAVCTSPHTLVRRPATKLALHARR